MSTPSALAAERKRSWYLLNVLACLGTPALLLFCGFATYLSRTDNLPKLDLPVVVRALLVIGFFALLWLWVRMLVDFFRERPKSHPVAWGWALVLGLYFGGLLYFWAVWRPRNNPHDT